MESFLLSGLFGCIVISVCCLNIYELLRYIWNKLPNMQVMPRVRVLIVVAAIFISHIANIWVFGAVYYFFSQYGIGELVAASELEDQVHHLPDLVSCIYYSGVVYTTLGLGDMIPTGALRMITNVESLTGFILIGWTVSFTYLAMVKFWELPHKRK